MTLEVFYFVMMAILAAAIALIYVLKAKIQQVYYPILRLSVSS